MQTAIKTDEDAMRTYVAEINGEAIVAFRAVDDESAQGEVEDNGISSFRPPISRVGKRQADALSP